MSHLSSVDLLALHAVRILGFADAVAISERFRLDASRTRSLLEDFRALGWVNHATFADLSGWSLSQTGKAENERQLAAELRNVGGDELGTVYRDFLPLNARLQRACTDWQLRPSPGDQLATNDHTDLRWDAAVLDELAAIQRGLVPLSQCLDAILIRFRGYDTRFSAALHRARAGDNGWVDRTDIDSCHRVWFELHEDLIATLGLDRSAPR